MGFDNNGGESAGGKLVTQWTMLNMTTPLQVSAIAWNREYREMISAHGNPKAPDDSLEVSLHAAY